MACFNIALPLRRHDFPMDIRVSVYPKLITHGDLTTGKDQVGFYPTPISTGCFCHAPLFVAAMDVLIRDLTVVKPPLIPFLKEPWTSKSKYPAILLVTFLYGVYVVLFGYCAIIIAKRKLVQRVLLSVLIALFLLASADIAVTLFFFFHFVLSTVFNSNGKAVLDETSHGPWSRTLMYKFALYIFANAIASGLLIGRCYTVWRNKRIIVAPTVLAICGTVISFASMKATQLGDRLLAASFITSAAANISVTLLIAIRIWWFSRKIRSPVRMDLSAISSLVTSLILDSGVIYSLSIFFYLLLHTLVLDASLTQIAGITATAIILRNSHSEANTTFDTTSTPSIQSDMRTTSTMGRHRTPAVATQLSRNDISSSIDSNGVEFK